MSYALTAGPQAWIYGDNKWDRTDDLLLGWAVEVQKQEGEWCGIETHYGYKGYVRREDLIPVEREALKERDRSGKTRVVIRRFMDVLDAPKVQGQILATLGRGCLVEDTGTKEGGYDLVRLPDGREGYISHTALMDRADSDEYFFSSDREHYFLNQKLPLPEEEMRKKIVQMTQLYEGGQYRWAGKAADGTDCSGLAFMSCFLSGILIYRDAQIMERWPVKKIELSRIGPGDFLYFPGHIAIYIGDGKYIHSTGYAKNFGVAVNSLREGDENYRKDLAGEITAAGSIFAE